MDAESAADGGGGIDPCDVCQSLEFRRMKETFQELAMLFKQEPSFENFLDLEKDDIKAPDPSLRCKLPGKPKPDAPELQGVALLRFYVCTCFSGADEQVANFVYAWYEKTTKTSKKPESHAQMLIGWQNNFLYYVFLELHPVVAWARDIAHQYTSQAKMFATEETATARAPPGGVGLKKDAACAEAFEAQSAITASTLPLYDTEKEQATFRLNKAAVKQWADALWQCEAQAEFFVEQVDAEMYKRWFRDGMPAELEAWRSFNVSYGESVARDRGDWDTEEEPAAEYVATFLRDVFRNIPEHIDDVSPNFRRHDPRWQEKMARWHELRDGVKDFLRRAVGALRPSVSPAALEKISLSNLFVFYSFRRYPEVLTDVKNAKRLWRLLDIPKVAPEMQRALSVLMRLVEHPEEAQYSSVVELLGQWEGKCESVSKFRTLVQYKSAHHDTALKWVRWHQKDTALSPGARKQLKAIAALLVNVVKGIDRQTGPSAGSVVDAAAQEVRADGLAP
eukprot:g10196.t1